MEKINRKTIVVAQEEANIHEKEYLDIFNKLSVLEEECKRLKDSLRCRYCGDKIYAKGYCKACYNRAIVFGLPLKRKYESKEQVQPRTPRTNLSKIREIGFTDKAELTRDDFETIVLFSTLSERSKDVMSMYFCENKTHREIAAKCGFTYQRSQQIVNASMKKCRLVWRKDKEVE